MRAGSEQRTHIRGLQGLGKFLGVAVYPGPRSMQNNGSNPLQTVQNPGTGFGNLAFEYLHPVGFSTCRLAGVVLESVPIPLEASNSTHSGNTTWNHPHNGALYRLLPSFKGPVSGSMLVFRSVDCGIKLCFRYVPNPVGGFLLAKIGLCFFYPKVLM